MKVCNTVIFGKTLHVSEKQIAFMFRVEERPKQNTSKKQKASRAIAYSPLIAGFFLVLFIYFVAVRVVPPKRRAFSDVCNFKPQRPYYLYA
jgi:hypothetical protein